MKLLFLVYSVALLVFAWNSDTLLATDYIQSLSYPVIGTLVLYLLLHLPNFVFSAKYRFLFFVTVVDFAFLIVIFGWAFISHESLGKTILNSSTAVQAFMITHSILLMIDVIMFWKRTSRSVTSTDLGYLSGVTSAIQTQNDETVDEEDEHEEVIMRFESVDPEAKIFLLEGGESYLPRNTLISLLNEIKEQFRVKTETVSCGAYKQLLVDHFSLDKSDDPVSWHGDRIEVKSFDWRYSDSSKTEIEVLARFDSTEYREYHLGDFKFTIFINPETKKPELSFVYQNLEY